MTMGSNVNHGGINDKACLPVRDTPGPGTGKESRSCSTGIENSHLW